MEPTERVIGALHEFKKHADKRLDSLEAKVDALQQFKWRVAGGMAVLSTIVIGVVEAIRIAAGK